MTWKPDPLKVAADRINAGEPVSEGYVYGRGADRLLRFGMVTAERLEEYRRGMWESTKELLGEEEANKRRAQLLARHRKLTE